MSPLTGTPNAWPHTRLSGRSDDRPGAQTSRAGRSAHRRMQGPHSQPGGSNPAACSTRETHIVGGGCARSAFSLPRREVTAVLAAGAAKELHVDLPPCFAWLEG